MRNAQIEIADIAGQLDSVRQELDIQLAELRARQTELAAQMQSLLEARTAAAPQAVVTQVRTKSTEQEPIPEEILVVISAAVAAFLGVPARVRSAHYVHEGLSPWAQQGRVFVQASHNLVHHG